MGKEQELRALQAEICQALLNAFPMDDKVADAHAAVAAKIVDANRSATAEAWRGIAPDGRTGLTDNRRVVEKWQAEGREVTPLCTARRSSSDEAEVVADQRMPLAHAILDLAFTEKPSLNQLIVNSMITAAANVARDWPSPLYASPSGVKAGVTEAMVDAALKAQPRNSPVSYFLNPNHNLTPEYVRELMRAALTAALGVSDEGMGEGWQPIETAPKDGTEIHVFAQTEEGVQIQQVVFWDAHSATGFPWCLHDGASYQASLFTHWRPLATPPIQGDAK